MPRAEYNGRWGVRQNGQSVMIGRGYKRRADAEAECERMRHLAPAYEWTVFDRYAIGEAETNSSGPPGV